MSTRTALITLNEYIPLPSTAIHPPPRPLRTALRRNDKISTPGYWLEIPIFGTCFAFTRQLRRPAEKRVSLTLF